MMQPGHGVTSQVEKLIVIILHLKPIDFIQEHDYHPLA
jgi:hypothetical protein